MSNGTRARAHLTQVEGAELAITGTVQKISNLILNMNIYVRDALSGATIATMSADMRGNTDETWSRTLDWLVRHRFLAPGYGLHSSDSRGRMPDRARNCRFDGRSTRPATGSAL